MNENGLIPTNLLRATVVAGSFAVAVMVGTPAAAHFVSLDGSVEVDSPGYVKTSDGKAVTSSSGCVVTGDRTADNQINACEGIEEPAAEPEAEPEPVQEEEPAEQEPVSQTMSLDGSALFATDSSELTGNGEAALMDLVNELKAMQEVSSIDIVGHTDNRGSIEYNQQLSEQRAQTVASYIQSQLSGAPINSVTGLGELNPASSNDTPGGRQANRRVEVAVTGVVVK